MEEDLTGMHVDHKEVDEMTADEKSFFYFKIHDTDGNDNLDGLEMIKAAIHRHGNFELQDELMHVTSKSSSLVVFGMMTITFLLSDVVDEFLDFADLNRDGFLNYAEYVKAMNSSQETVANPPLSSSSNMQNGIED